MDPPGKPVSLLLVTDGGEIIFVGIDGFAGPVNGRATVIDDDHIRFTYDAGGRLGRAETTYLERIIPGDDVYRMDGFDQNGTKIKIRGNRQRNKDWDIVAVRIEISS